MFISSSANFLGTFQPVPAKKIGHVQDSLGDVPLAYANGEIAGDPIYGYTKSG
ncbi:MAG: hypothetical protein ACLPX9_08620 [Rhodomicrobium sp.]